MDSDQIEYRERRDLSIESIVNLYQTNAWSSAEKPQALRNALLNSHALISAWSDNDLVWLGNAIVDGQLVVYCAHVLVRPDHHRLGIGTETIRRLTRKYDGFHRKMCEADIKRVKSFYESLGFKRADTAKSMWIFAGREH